MMARPLKIFFSGIGGSGMSAIAHFMRDKGHTVAGSDRTFDRNPDHPLCRSFKKKGITIVPQDGNGINRSFDFVVFSTAIEQGNVEMAKAKSLEIPIKTRPEYLEEIIISCNTIAIAGTSGKSTTAGMLAFMMQRLGFNPNFVGGGRVKQFKTESNPGNYVTGESDYLVVEACESDGTIVRYRPKHSIILNLALDHHPVEKTSELFEALIENTKGMIIINADDELFKKINVSNTITFSLDNPSHYMATDIVCKPFNTDFSLNGMRISLPLPGKYNLCNALSCIAILSEMGISIKDIANVLHEFRGIERRFDIYLNDGERLVIDDYAHNPHKILSLMQTVKAIRKRVCYIFQPHGFTPTRMMKNEYIEAFEEGLRDSDHLMILPIYYAGGAVSKDISSNDLASEIGARGRSVEVVTNRKAVLEMLKEWESYVVLGARDETLADFAREIAETIAAINEKR